MSETNRCREADLRHLRDEGVVWFVSLDAHDRAVTLTERGHRLLETHRCDRFDELCKLLLGDL